MGSKRINHRSNERRIAFSILIVAGIAAIVLSAVFLFSNRGHDIRLVGGKTIYYVDNEVFDLKGEPVMCNGKEYFPAEDILQRCGFSTYYNPEISAVAVADRDGTSYIYINDNVITYLGENKSFSNRTFLINDILYITRDMFSIFTDDDVSFEGDLKVIAMPL